MRQLADKVAIWMARPAERLVLEGCRRLTAPGSRIEDARPLFAEIAGDRVGDAMLAELVRFLAVLGPCAQCPLRGFPSGASHISRDEALVMALVAGIQHGDEQVVDACLAHLACATRCREVESAAAIFAITMRSFGHRLMPIPLPAVEDILLRSRSVTVH